MTKNSKNQKVKSFPRQSVDLPDFVIQNDIKDVLATDGTNVIRVPFGIRLSKKQRPDKNQNIATLILPINRYSSPNPPPNVA